MADNAPQDLTEQPVQPSGSSTVQSAWVIGTLGTKAEDRSLRVRPSDGVFEPFQPQGGQQVGEVAAALLHNNDLQDLQLVGHLPEHDAMGVLIGRCAKVDPGTVRQVARLAERSQRFGLHVASTHLLDHSECFDKQPGILLVQLAEI